MLTGVWEDAQLWALQRWKDLQAIQIALQGDGMSGLRPHTRADPPSGHAAGPRGTSPDASEDPGEGVARGRRHGHPGGRGRHGGAQRLAGGEDAEVTAQCTSQRKGAPKGPRSGLRGSADHGQSK